MLARLLGELTLLARSETVEDGDLGASSRSRRAGPTPPAPDGELGQPRATHRAEPAPAGRSAVAATRVTKNPAALARPAGRPPLDLPACPLRPPTHSTAVPG